MDNSGGGSSNNDDVSAGDNLASKNRRRRAVARGKRTGVQVFAAKDVPVGADGMEDMDAFFDAAKSPPQPPETTATMESEESAKAATKKKVPTTTKKDEKIKAYKEPRFSLDGDQDDDATNDQLSSYVQRLKSDRGSISISELSPVSTAPPSQDRSKVDLKQAQHANDEEELMDAMHPESPDLPPENQDQEDDDLIPPPPPDSPEPEENEEGDLPPITQEPVEKDSEDGPPNDDDDDHDNDGVGFNIVGEDQETPASNKEQKKRKKTVRVVEDPSVVSTRKGKKSKKSRFATQFSPKGYQTGPREFTSVPVSDLKEPPSPSGENLRRSKRAKIQPLEYWKNERIVYGPTNWDDIDEEIEVSESLRNMPIPKAVSKAEPTPYKKRKVDPKRKKAAAKAKKKGGRLSESEFTPIAEAAAIKPFDTRKLKYRYEEGESTVLWDDCIEEATELKVVSHAADLTQRDLPITKPRKRYEGKVVCRAGQAFNVPNDENPAYVGYLMGNITIPPKGIKCPESVGSCSQLFTVVTCQPQAVEIAYGDPHDDSSTLAAATAKRFLLNEGDMFRIPPGNSYRLQNHSRETECFMTWTIIRPAQV